MTDFIGSRPLKVMLASVDPLGLPLMTSVLAGNAADDGLYLPAIERGRSVLGRGAQLGSGAKRDRSPIMAADG